MVKRFRLWLHRGRRKRRVTLEATRSRQTPNLGRPRSARKTRFTRAPFPNVDQGRAIRNRDPSSANIPIKKSICSTHCGTYGLKRRDTRKPRRCGTRCRYRRKCGQRSITIYLDGNATAIGRNFKGGIAQDWTITSLSQDGKRIHLCPVGLRAQGSELREANRNRDRRILNGGTILPPNRAL